MSRVRSLWCKMCIHTMLYIFIILQILKIIK